MDGARAYVSYRRSARNRPAHADRRRQFTRTLPAVVALVVVVAAGLVVVAAGSRLLMDSGGANQPGATTTTTTAPGSTAGGRAQASLDASANLTATIDIRWSSPPDALRLTVPAETAYGFHPRVAISLLEAGGAEVPIIENDVWVLS